MWEWLVLGFPPDLVDEDHWRWGLHFKLGYQDSFCEMNKATFKNRTRILNVSPGYPWFLDKEQNSNERESVI